MRRVPMRHAAAGIAENFDRRFWLVDVVVGGARYAKILWRHLDFD
jgi:hypothetical protein